MEKRRAKRAHGLKGLSNLGSDHILLTSTKYDNHDGGFRGSQTQTSGVEFGNRIKNSEAWNAIRVATVRLDVETSGEKTLNPAKLTKFLNLF